MAIECILYLYRQMINKRSNLASVLSDHSMFLLNKILFVFDQDKNVKYT